MDLQKEASISAKIMILQSRVITYLHYLDNIRRGRDTIDSDIIMYTDDFPVIAEEIYDMYMEEQESARINTRYPS